MSRWTEAFAALSGGADFSDIIRRSNEPSSKLSQSVNTVSGLSHTSALLTPDSRANCAGGDWADAAEERAAIVEHDGAIPREWAEGFVRLNADKPPGDIPPRRWRQFVDDVGFFLDSQFCAAAATFGWGPHDLFGCDRERPFAQIDHAGLLWLLNGNRLIALSEGTATIEIGDGERHTWRRGPTYPGRVLPWQLIR